MTIEEINKWLDNEYGISYTKLEELHDFYFEKYCDLKQENQELKRNCNIGYENLNFYREENQELKKQLKELEEQSSNAINKQVARGIVLINQQKEFITYLENKINDWGSDNDIDYEVVEPTPQEIFEDVLLKYKKIIGVKDE